MTQFLHSWFYKLHLIEIFQTSDMLHCTTLEKTFKCSEMIIIYYVYSKRCEAMRLAGNWLLVYSLVTTILYQLLRLVFITVQRIYWQLNGTAQKLREARLPHNYERSAQVLDIVLYHKFCRLLTPALSNFLCTHNRFENPQYIIDNDNITIMCFDEHVAVFCEAKEKGRFLYTKVRVVYNC